MSSFVEHRPQCYATLIELVLVKRLYLMDSDWDFNMDEWRLMCRCNKCARQLYPYGPQSQQDAWALMAYKKCLNGHSSPEALRDKQSPRLMEMISKRPPKILYY